MHWKNASAERKIKFLKCLSLFYVIDMTKTLKDIFNASIPTF
jgi:hypothetical protein